MIGNVPEHIMEQFDNDNEQFAVAGISTTGWIKKAKYEHNEIVLDFRQVDDDGTLDLLTKLDKSSNKLIPEVKMVSGCLIVSLKREK